MAARSTRREARARILAAFSQDDRWTRYCSTRPAYPTAPRLDSTDAPDRVRLTQPQGPASMESWPSSP